MVRFDTQERHRSLEFQLTSNAGMKGLIITAASGTADTPRAHIVNEMTLECLRDIQVEDTMRLALDSEMIGAF